MEKAKESKAERAARIKFSENGRKLRQRTVESKKHKKDRYGDYLVLHDHD